MTDLEHTWSQRGFLTYFVEDLAVFQDAYGQALGKLAERD